MTVLTGPSSSPVLSVASTVVDSVPLGVKDWAVRTLGTDDKPVLVVSVLVVVLLLAALGGIRELGHRRGGLPVVVVLCLAAALAAINRPGAGAGAVLPSLVALVVSGWLLVVLGDRARWSGTAEAESADRRRFLALSGSTVLAAAAGAGVARVATLSRVDVTSSRDAVRLPAPVSPAASVSTGRGVAGATPFQTPLGDFYRVDTALFAPRIRAEDWKLRITGEVDHEVTLTFAELLHRPMIERWVTLACVSNEVGGDLVGNARWLGAPLADILRSAGPHEGADMVLSRSHDGMTIGTPLAALLDGRDAMLAVGMDGAPLPVERGFPVRMVVPGLYGYVSATKWVVELEVTRFSRATAYWSDRGWAEQAPVKTASRIDVPRDDVRAGRVAVGGVAWAQHRGVSKVEVRVDGGAWQQAELLPVPSVDTWRQWTWEWDATSGSHVLEVRATDGTGVTQTSRPADPAPDGATGWHSRQVHVH